MVKPLRSPSPGPTPSDSETASTTPSKTRNGSIDTTQTFPSFSYGSVHTSKVPPWRKASVQGNTEKANSNRESSKTGTSKPEPDDPWKDMNLDIEGKKVRWGELSTSGRIKYVVVDLFLNYTFRFGFLLCFLYLFVCSIALLSNAFRLLGGKAAGEAISNSKVFGNPICGLMLGVLVTVLVQSSSTSTSIFVAMVAAETLKVKQAIPMIMGANIGTSITNTIVSMGQYTSRNTFRRAFGGATVHDMFNWLCVLILLPLEVISGYLYHLSWWLVDDVFDLQQTDIEINLLKTITKPFYSKVVEVDKNVIKDIAKNEEGATTKRLLKIYCDKIEMMREVERNITQPQNITLITNGQEVVSLVNVTTTAIVNETYIVKEKCDHWFANSNLTDAQIGGILLIFSLSMMCICLVLIVKLLHSMLKGRIAVMVHKVVNTNFPGKFAFLTGYLAIAFGAFMTFLVQSSSVFTSAITPLVGIGVIRIDRMYALTLGANIGTTATGIIAALASSGIKLALQLALCHLFFNISGILIWYPIPFMRKIPIKLAKCLGDTTAKYRWFAPAYLLMVFLLLPMFVFGLSLVGLWLLLLILIPVAILALVVFVICILQKKRPIWLPEMLKTWKFLPLWLRSLQPLDHILTSIWKQLIQVCPKCKLCRNCSKPNIVSKKLKALTKFTVMPDLNKLKRKQDEEFFGYGGSEKYSTNINFDCSNPGYIQHEKSTSRSSSASISSHSVTGGYPALGHNSARRGYTAPHPATGNPAHRSYSTRDDQVFIPHSSGKINPIFYPNSTQTRYQAPGQNSARASPSLETAVTDDNERRTPSFYKQNAYV